MNTIVIAIAPVNRPTFKPICANFPVTNKALLGCLESPKAMEELISAGSRFLGISDDTPCVGACYYALPERNGGTFDDFLWNLEGAYRNARNELIKERNRRPAFIWPIPI